MDKKSSRKKSSRKKSSRKKSSRKKPPPACTICGGPQVIMWTIWGRRILVCNECDRSITY